MRGGGFPDTNLGGGGFLGISMELIWVGGSFHCTCFVLIWVGGVLLGTSMVLIWVVDGWFSWYLFGTNLGGGGFHGTYLGGGGVSWYLLGWVWPWKKSEKCPLVPSMVPIY